MKNKFVSLSIGLAVSCLTVGIISPAFAQSGNGSDVSGASVTGSGQAPGATTLPTFEATGGTAPGSTVPIVLRPPTDVPTSLSNVINASPPAETISPDSGRLPPGQVAQIINNNNSAGAVIANILNISTGGSGQGDVASQIAALNQTPTGAALVTNAVALGLSLQGLAQTGRINGIQLLKAVQAYNALITAAASAPTGVAGNLNANQISNIRNFLAPLVAAAIQQAQGN